MQVISPLADKAYLPVQCGKCKYSNQCFATSVGFTTRECKRKAPRRRAAALQQGDFSEPLSDSIKDNEGDNGNVRLRFRGVAVGLDKSHTPKVQHGVSDVLGDDDNDDDKQPTPDVAADDDSTQTDDDPTQTDDSEAHQRTPPDSDTNDDDLAQPDYSSTGDTGPDDDDSFQRQQGTSTGIDDNDDDIPVQPDHGTHGGGDDDTTVQPDHGTNDDDAPAPPDHGKSNGDDDDDPHDDDDAAIEPGTGSDTDDDDTPGMSAFVTIALVIVAMTGLIVAYRKLMLWRLQRTPSLPASDMPIWVRDPDTELETYNDRPDEKYSDRHGGGRNDNSMDSMLTFPIEEPTRPASASFKSSDHSPSFVGRAESNGAHDIC
jgi:hypothetical protein